MVDQIKVQMVPLWIEHDTLIIFLLGAVTCNHDCSPFNAVLNKERITSITSWFNFLNFNVTQRRLASSIEFIHKKVKHSFLILNEVRTGNIFFKNIFFGGGTSLIFWTDRSTVIKDRGPSFVPIIFTIRNSFDDLILNRK